MLSSSLSIVFNHGSLETRDNNFFYPVFRTQVIKQASILWACSCPALIKVWHFKNNVFWKINQNPSPAYIIDINNFEWFSTCNSILYHFWIWFINVLGHVIDWSEITQLSLLCWISRNGRLQFLEVHQLKVSTHFGINFSYLTWVMFQKLYAKSLSLKLFIICRLLCSLASKHTLMTKHKWYMHLKDIPAVYKLYGITPEIIVFYWPRLCSGFLSELRFILWWYNTDFGVLYLAETLLGDIPPAPAFKTFAFSSSGCRI